MKGLTRDVLWQEMQRRQRVEWVKCNAFKWFGRVERMFDWEFISRVYDNTIKGVGMRRKTTWGNRVEGFWMNTWNGVCEGSMEE